MAAPRTSRTRSPKTTSPAGPAPEQNGQTATADGHAGAVRAPRARKKAAAPRSAKDMAKVRQAAMLLKQVSDPTRLQVLMLLAERERNVGTLCSDLGGQSQPAVSHHLALLRHGRLIEPRREGKNNVYSLTAAGRDLAETVRTIVG